MYARTARRLHRDQTDEPRHEPPRRDTPIHKNLQDLFRVIIPHEKMRDGPHRYGDLLANRTADAKSARAGWRMSVVRRILAVYERSPWASARRRGGRQVPV
jgi:hypothetical protein